MLMADRIVKIIFTDPSQIINEKLVLFKELSEQNYYHKMTYIGIVLHESRDSITVTPEKTDKNLIREFMCIPKRCIIEQYELENFSNVKNRGGDY